MLRKMRKRARLPSCSEPLRKRRPEGLRHGGGVNRAARLDDVLARLQLLIGILGAEEGAAGAGRELGEQIPDLGEMLGRAALIDNTAEELAELIDLEQRRRLAAEGGEQAGAGCQAVAAEMLGEAGGEKRLLDRVAGVILAAAAGGHADDV